jgi:hypothetical protein
MKNSITCAQPHRQCLNFSLYLKHFTSFFLLLHVNSSRAFFLRQRNSVKAMQKRQLFLVHVFTRNPSSILCNIVDWGKNFGVLAKPEPFPTPEISVRNVVLRHGKDLWHFVPLAKKLDETNDFRGRLPLALKEKNEKSTEGIYFWE